MLPSVILEGRLRLSNEDNYFEQIFRESGTQKIPGRVNEKEASDETGLYVGIQTLLTLA